MRTLYRTASTDGHPIMASRNEGGLSPVIVLSVGPRYQGLTLYMDPEQARRIVAVLTEQLTAAEVLG